MKVETYLPPDPALPQLSTVLNAAAMQKTLQSYLFAETTRFLIKDCEIEWVKYKPGKNCMLCCLTRIYDGSTEQIEDQRFCLRIYEPGGSASRFKKGLSERLVSPKFGKALTHIPELEMLVWAFPNDRKLHGLPMISDTKILQENILPELLRHSPHHHWRIEEVFSDVIHYVPEHTCTLRVELRLFEFNTNNRKTMTLFGKTYYNEDGRKADSMMRHLWKSESRRSGALGMAQSLGYHERSKSFWQYALPGGTLLDSDMSSPRFLVLLEEAGSVVGALHISSLEGLPSIRMGDWLNKLKETRSLIIGRRSRCQKELTPLVQRLLLQSQDLTVLPPGTLHGDLHLNNFFVSEGRVSLIDMDDLAEGPPLLDIGSFLAGLFYRGLLARHPTSLIQTICETFLRGYQKSVGWHISRSDLEWYVATALINERAYRCLARVKAGRLDILDDLIDLADQVSLGKTPFWSSKNEPK